MQGVFFLFPFTFGLIIRQCKDNTPIGFNPRVASIQFSSSMISSREWDNQHHQHLSDKNPIPFTATFSACLANH
ncbi:hypothetical protein DERF_011503 [Dermatophagoides farinae]|uniref:Uncharacterized protein n=1 Tax=Dermatophagoides farinae TaxID=6954 RepID=A0A922HW81_DERFA|nr:hypothetical protein DERF_011503 [Dermatophagoides farinae]